MNRSAQAIGWCPVHEKLLYLTRKTAKVAARKHPSHKNEFRCDQNSDMWHIGELPLQVIHGEMTRTEYFGY